MEHLTSDYREPSEDVPAPRAGAGAGGRSGAVSPRQPRAAALRGLRACAFTWTGKISTRIIIACKL